MKLRRSAAVLVGLATAATMAVGGATTATAAGEPSQVKRVKVGVGAGPDTAAREVAPAEVAAKF